ncbi:hypothetical protein TEA_006174 [Camellia sinensis var. sinensis]|uniref:Uncharacterized protein n=1 Tax=Camellia sinensis var. sinensis TaxID=542762 RepID=A0A4S4DGD9_CAMSN|nr:hypothetical protein TEA_006174 [Camellia sinensis var. sinensis]
MLGRGCKSGDRRWPEEGKRGVFQTGAAGVQRHGEAWQEGQQGRGRWVVKGGGGRGDRKGRGWALIASWKAMGWVLAASWEGVGSGNNYGSVEPEPISNFLIRFKNAVRLQVRQSLFSVFASNANPSDQDPLTEKSGGIKTNDAGQGPPLPTILAGLVVFFLIFWIIGSILTWLISLIVRFPPSE